MVYWDSSALVAFFLFEEETQKVRSFMKGKEEQSYTSIITPLEVESAIQRKLKEQTISSTLGTKARMNLSQFRKESFLVVADQNVLDIALHVQKIYSLRVADSLQLACARIATPDPSKVDFLCLDEKLSDAAKQEGFNLALE